MQNKIAILTSGGDSCGMNAAVRAIVKTAINNQVEPYLVFEGYKGLVEGNIKKASEDDVKNILTKGGTKIYSARLKEFADANVRQKAIDNLKKLGIEHLAVIGGDGSYMGASLLAKSGIKVYGLPGTIDNDVRSSAFTLGFDTSLNVIVDAVSKIRDSAESHRRVSFVELMGRHCVDLTIRAAYATGAEIVLTGYNVMKIDEIISRVEKAAKKNRSVLVLCTELVYGNNGLPTLNEIVSEVQKKTGLETRLTVLGHIQRGGTPSALDRYIGSIMGAEVISLMLNKRFNIALGFDGSKVSTLDIQTAVELKDKFDPAVLDAIMSLNQ